MLRMYITFETTIVEKLVSERYINYNILLVLVTIPAKNFDGAKSQNV